MTDRLSIIDAALTEFSTRDSVPADPIIDAISEVDPTAAAALAAVASRFAVAGEDVNSLIRKEQRDPGVLHARDALDILIDLRNSVKAEVPEPELVSA